MQSEGHNICYVQIIVTNQVISDMKASSNHSITGINFEVFLFYFILFILTITCYLFFYEHDYHFFYVEDSCSDDLFIESFSENDDNDETLFTL